MTVAFYADFGFQNGYDYLDISLLRQPVLSNCLAMLMTAACAASQTDQESREVPAPLSDRHDAGFAY